MTKTGEAVAPAQIVSKKLNSGVALLYFDAPGKANYLTSDVVSEFATLLSELEADRSVLAVGILSGKPDTFLLGADLREIMKMETPEAALRVASDGQKIFNRLAQFKKPVVAGIHGVCLGGGLELALCCRKRIATDSDATLIGLPEVRLGFVPGLGGTQRLPRLIALKEALELIVTAEPVSALRAFEIGLVDALVKHDDLEKIVESTALSLLDDQNGDRPEPAPLDAKQQASIFSMMKRAIRIKTKGRYPAQSRVIDVVQFGLENGIERGLEEEARAFAELALTDISRNLVALYFATELARHSAVSSAQKEKEDAVQTIGVIGGGLMGVSLCKLAALNGFKVLFRSVRRENLEQAAEQVRETLQKASSRNREDNSTNLLENFHVVLDDREFSACDLIFEAAGENLAGKVKTFKDIQPHLKDGCVLATITSSLTVNALKEKLAANTPLVAIHFFHPVERMQLVEIASESKAAISKASAFISKLSKIPVYVKDSPCFLVNRLLCCYLLEAARLAEARVPLNWLEDAALEFGMPMGPLDLLDEVGLDVAVMVAEALNAAHGDRILLPKVLTRVKELGIKGKKSEAGIYQRDETGKKLGFDPRLVEQLNLVVSPERPSEEKIQELCARMILPMVDEAARCLEEKIVRRPREIDVATILGIGFPPFRGGLLKYADNYGAAELFSELKNVYAQTEPKRSVSKVIEKMAHDGGSFYGGKTVAD